MNKTSFFTKTAMTIISFILLSGCAQTAMQDSKMMEPMKTETMETKGSMDNMGSSTMMNEKEETMMK